MPRNSKMTPARVGIGALAALLSFGAVQAQVLESTVQTETKINQDAEASQTRINSLASQTQDLIAQYRSVVREYENTKIYNDQLQKVVDDQRATVTSINNQLEGLEATNRGITPLMLDMIERLGQIIEADIPFRINERRDLVGRLEAMMDDSGITTSEKYRNILEAYQTELEFGRTTESYAGELPTTGQTVDFLRVGRTLLIYQTGDGGETGWFNPATREFEELPGSYAIDVREGLAIAKNEKAPDLVVLPVTGPGEAQ